TAKRRTSTSTMPNTRRAAAAANPSAPGHCRCQPNPTTTSQSVRQAVLDRLLDDGLNVQRTRAAMKPDFLLELSSGFVYACLDWQLARLNLTQHRRRTLERFSGTLCVDELHLGKHTLLLATDPLADEIIGFALVDDNDQAHLRRF